MRPFRTVLLPLLALGGSFVCGTAGADPPPSCGDGVANHGEQCDDGNPVDWDGCDSDCRTTLWLAVDRSPGSTAAELSWTGAFPRFAVHRASDPAAASGVESRVADTETRAYQDLDVPPPGGVFHYRILSYCGNGVTDPGEGCDDGNNYDLDGCNADCTGLPCGNGVPDPGEECDDGAANSDTEPDACRTDCVAATCGDAVVDSGEECDEGEANADGGPAACRTDCTVSWHGGTRRHRVALHVAANGFARTDKVVEAPLDLQALLVAAGGTGTVVRESLLLVEVDPSGEPLSAAVPFQFDGGSAGELVWLLEGTTPSGATRHFQLYFDSLPHPTPVFEDRVAVTDDYHDEGQLAFRVATGNGTWLFQKEAGGLSGLVDRRGHDWISFGAAAGSAGQYRGVPNLTYPSNLFHPGSSAASSVLLHDGPLRATVESPSDNGQFRTRWDFYPGHARMTVLQATGNYWFMYEGTPGGRLDRTGPNADLLRKSDGSQATVATSWGTGQDLAGDEWVYFADPEAGRSVFLAHHTNDAVTDWYEPLDSPAGGPASDWMTVFGFGRGPGSTNLLAGAPRSFSVGLLETTQFSTAEAAIRSAYKDVAVSADAAERRNAGCGDGILDPGEACDDGNADTGDGCAPGCVSEHVCGDGDPTGAEECDDGNTDGGDGCDPGCIVEECGNGVAQAGEECDDGNLEELDACGNDCLANGCGDGELQQGETCDLGVLNGDEPDDPCRTDCTAQRCGDGVLDTGEACDDGNAASTDACVAGCTVAVCGDGFVQQGVEPCDDGNAVETDACRPGCIAASCGDGIVRAGVESCDDGNATDGDTCTIYCRANVIGNGTFAAGTAQWSFFTDGQASFSTPGGEARIAVTTPGTNVQLMQLPVAVSGATGYVLRFRARSTGGQDFWVRLHKDTAPYTNYGLNQRVFLGTTNETFSIPFTTTAGDKTDGRFVFWLAEYDAAGMSFYIDDVALERAGRCGDAVLDPGEECDDGNAIGGDGCQPACLDPQCGDGFLDAGEECDDGNAIAADGCQPACLAPRCGDGFLDAGEECDDGNTADGDACRADCSTTCGDGIVGPGEECDLGAANGDLPGAQCRTDCRLAGCGDGILEPSEACDDGNDLPYDGCAPDCTAEEPSCGNGHREAGEACDDGNDVAGDGCEPGCVLAVPTHFRHPRPGEVYKEFTRVMGGTYNWRVTDPDSTYEGDPENEPAAFLPNPQLPLAIDDLDGAVRAEVLIDLWGGHIGTAIKRFRVNGNPYIAIPELNTTSGPGPCYAQQRNVVVEIPLADLVAGTNVFEGTTGNQTCHSFGWGQFGWYSLTVRVYYGAGKPHPTGAVTSPLAGVTIPDPPTITAEAQSPAGIRKVEFFAYYEGVDADGDGRHTDWHGAYQRGPTDPTVTVSRHVGTDTTFPYGVTWDTTLVPDQVPGTLRLGARIEDETGTWFVTDEVAGLTLARPGYVRRLYKASDTPENFVVRAGASKSATLTIPAGHDLGAATDARLVMRTWNGSDGGAEPGELHSTKLNLWQAPAYGRSHFYAFSVLAVPVGTLLGGTNTVTVQSDSVAHGIEVLWPGPQLVVQYASPPGPCGNGAPDPGEACDDGNVANEDGCNALCETEGCGDGAIQPGLDEQCDDGNLAAGDGCGTTCRFEGCGNLIVEPGEQCDDGNTLDGDGCSAGCLLENPCGNGALDPGELCDDGNTLSGDGCSSTCRRIVSDDFSAATLDAALWSVEDPLGDATVGLVGTGTADARLEIAVPGGVAHDAWSTNLAPRVVQDADDSDLDVTVKLESVVSAGNQFQGIYVGQDENDWLRFDVYSDGAGYRGFIARATGGSMGAVQNVPIAAGPSPPVLYLRVVREDDDWTFSRSLDGTSWTPIGTSFPSSLAVSAVGVHAGNGAANPAHTARFDWFFDSAAPIDPEDPPSCGNGEPDPGEECDAGPANSDSVPDACRTDCTLPRCGDAVVDTGEACDDGNDVDGDGCQSGCVAPQCGDGILDPGEACDDGPANSDSVPGACRTDCDLPGCGDGVVDPGEACDLGPSNSEDPGATCRTDCEAAGCGDEVVDPGEECDLGPGNTDLPDAGCRPGCLLPGCGDGTHDSAEECDDGNLEDGDGCTAGCLLETPCGNGTLDPGELCDDGNTQSGDGCSATCRRIASDDFSAPALDAALWTVTDPLGDATITLSGTGTANARLAIAVPAGSAHDTLIPDRAPRVMQGADDSDFDVHARFESSVGSGNQFQGILVREDDEHWLRFDVYSDGTQYRSFVARRDGPSVTLVHNLPLGSGPSPADLHLRVTRAGDTWTFRRSTDGASWTVSGASFGAALEVREVGVHAGNGEANPAHTARVDWFFDTAAPIVPEDPVTCGDGDVDPGEACDDGAANSDTEPDACRTDCTAPRCSDGVTDTGEECDDGNLVDADGCQSTCALPACGDGVVDAGEACDGGAANSDTEPDACRTDCALPGCGDDVTDAGEACDDGAANSDDPGAACRSDCSLAGCGDGIVDPGESCDLGGANSDEPDAPCRTGCSAAGCGDGIADSGEECDDGNALDGDGCSAACALESLCGNGALDAGELCDDGNTLSGDGCSSTCRRIVSDDFSGPALDAALWSVEDPLGDATVGLIGSGTANARLEIAVPGGVAHDAWSTNLAPRVVQGADDSDFDVQVKLESVVAVGNQFQGIYVEQDADDWLRFDVYSDGTGYRGFIARSTGGSMGAVQNVAIGTGPSPAVFYLRVSRVGDGWTFRRSFDGTGWTTIGTSFTSSLAVNAVGVHAGNGGANPAHAARFDWFFDTAAPIEPEDPGTCGDGTLVAGEDCDEGGANSDDPGATCRLDCTLAGCGDEIVDPGEACDEGAANSDAPGATCRLDCRLGGCGDGILDLFEPCDLGAANSDAPGAACRTDCSLGGCGDGIVDPGEACDEGAENGDEPGATCRADCSDGGCGDGILDPGEDCDDAEDNSDVLPDACRGDCTAAGCGDGVLDAGELCDDGNAAAGDGCSATCKRLVSDDFRSGSLAPDVWTALDPLGDSTFAITGVGTASARLEVAVPAGVAHDYWTANDSPRVMQQVDDSDFLVETKLESASMQLNAQFQGFLVVQDATHWLRFSAVATGSSCLAIVTTRNGTGSPANPRTASIATGACPNPLYLQLERVGPNWTSRWSLNGTSWTAVGASVPYALAVAEVGLLSGNAATNPSFTGRFDWFFDAAAPIVPEDTVTCGNGTLDPEEQCDDGAANSDSVPDACRTDCSAPACGDGVADTGEACDLGAANSDAPDATCRTSCTIGGCGDGIVDTVETCDDGNTTGGDGCSAGCLLETPCGDGDLDPGEVCDDGNTLSGDGCSRFCQRFASDDFDAAALGPQWSIVDPLGDATFATTGTGTADARLEIAVPGGTSHDAWNVNLAPRAMQGADDGDFTVEIKLESPLSAGNHFQGIVIEEDADDWLRFDFYSDGTSWYAFAAKTVGGATTPVRHTNLGAAPSPAVVWLLVQRTDDTWRFRYSIDGSTWVNVGSTFVHELEVRAIGVQAGNGAGNPPHTARFDYFFDVAAPVVPEDGP